MLNKTAVLENSCFYSSVPAEAVSTAILVRIILQFMLPYEHKS